MTFFPSLPQHAYSAKQVRENEAQVAQLQNISMYQLMEQAGKAAFSVLKKNSNYTKKNGAQKLLVVCGKGNNGGDGFVVARLAQQAGWQVQVIVLVETNLIKGDALQALNHYVNAEGNIDVCTEKEQLDEIISQIDIDIIVDAILGTGFTGELKLLFQQAIKAINDNTAKVLSIDIPSGLVADTGASSSAVIKADKTVTFIALKQGLLTGKAANFVGELYFEGLTVDHVFTEQVRSDIYLLTQATKPTLAPRKSASHKGDIGLVLTIGGGQGMPGAIRLASESALRCGAALVAVCCAENNYAMVINGRPELMLAPSNIDALKVSRVLAKAKAVVIGPGLGRNSWAKNHYEFAQSLKNKIMIIDADGLYFLAQNPTVNNRRILTPHPQEAAVLLNCSVEDVEADRFSAVNKLVQKYGGICLLKGAGSLICNGKQTWINTSGNAGMASAGMGDVLSGIIAALCLQYSLQCDDLFTAVKLAVYLHGKAADEVALKNGQRGILASDLFLPLQQLVNE